MIKQVVCLHWGTKFGAHYVDRLYAMVARNITPPFRFVCFCDGAAKFRREVEAHPLPPLDFEVPKTKLGIWQKCRLWSARLADLQGAVLYLDLDMVIVGGIDSFFEYGDADCVMMARNPSNPFERLGQTSIYRFPAGKLSPLLDKFAADPKNIAERYVYEQRFVTRNAPGGAQFFPRRWVDHFRHDCRRVFPLNYFLPPKLRRAAKIVIFPGGLHPDRAAEGRYYYGRDTRHYAPLEHIRAGFAGDREAGLLKHLRHYILPTPWIKNHWRE